MLLLTGLLAIVAGAVLALLGYKGQPIRMMATASYSLLLVGYIVAWTTAPGKGKLLSLRTLTSISVVILLGGLLLMEAYPRWRHELRVWTLLPCLILIFCIVVVRLFVSLRAKVPEEYAGADAIQLNEWELDKYVGVYMHSASTGGLIKAPGWITVAREGKVLSAQAKDQNSFPLEAIGNDTFRYVRAGVVMEFGLADHSFVLKQYGKEFIYRKETAA